MDIQAFIAARRDGGRHTVEELRAFAKGAADGSIPDYQLAAWLMAAYLKPLDEQETAWLTLAMADSGERLDLTGLPKPWVDKHSTGGVGDKTSIVLLPMLASCGLTVVKMSGRGLGITGGTVDKLESIPGFRLDLSPDEMKLQAKRIGIALTGQTPDLAPADKVLYALRDVTSTVSSVPLIVSSILSKKLAGGAETIVLDVKCGSGAFMPDLPSAQTLAAALKRTAELCGLNLRLAISDMDQPLGTHIGNALEVEEALGVLQGQVSRFSQLCTRLAGLTLHASGLADSQEAGEAAARQALESGAAKRKAEEWFAAQGATVDAFRADALERAPVQRQLKHAGPSGWVYRVDALTIGSAVVHLGGGRLKKTDSVDHAVGIVMGVEVGSHVQQGDVVLTIHARTDASADAAQAALSHAVQVSEIEVPKRPPIIELL